MVFALFRWPYKLFIHLFLRVVIARILRVVIARIRIRSFPLIT